MASANKFTEIVLYLLDLPAELLNIFKAKKFTEDTLINISRDELGESLQSEETEWNINEIFRRLTEWRKANGCGLFTFDEVYVQEEYTQEDDAQEDDAQEDDAQEDDAQEDDAQEDDAQEDDAQEDDAQEDDAQEDDAQEDDAQEDDAQEDDAQEDDAQEDDAQEDDAQEDDAQEDDAQEEDVQEEDGQEDDAQEENTPPRGNNQPTDVSDGIKPLFKNPPEPVDASDKIAPSVQIKVVKRFCVKTLVDLLNTTITGKEILKRGQRGLLSKESQRELVGVIADYHISLGTSLKEESLRDYGEAIVAQFRHETLDTYFVARSGKRKNHGGKLFNRITNLKQKLIKRAFKEEEHLHGKKSKVDPFVPKDPVAEEAILWLEQNSCPWSTVLDKWIVSFDIRKPHLLKSKIVEEVLTRHRHYSGKHGYQIIDIDFKLLKLGNDKGINKWDQFLPKIIEYLDKPYKDELSINLLGFIKTPGADKNSIISAVLILLNNVLKPTKVTKTFKPSILSAQEDIIFFAETNGQAVQKINDFNSSYESLGFYTIPKLVFRGKDITSLSGGYEVHYKSIVYKLETAERAIDVLVKLSTIFGLEYSRICRLVWNFICSYVYDLVVPEQYESINNLKRFLPKIQ
ncbi:uncharacterized protein LOC135706888 [Ochlerotatus camptorhynchus]|uniref:uncharacterized protein LOC135706888 n=1 Tax=Ochlerotatus camptorhynchus TaxID=644619 RepID=UPI0031E3D71F